MKLFRKIILVGLVYLSGALDGEEPGFAGTIPSMDKADTIVSFLTSQASFLKSVNSFEYKIRADNVGPRAGDFFVTMHWSEASDGRFKYEWKQIERNGHELNRAGAFDGVSFQTLQTGGPRIQLNTRRGLPAPRLDMKEEQYVTSPFRFATLGTASEDKHAAPELDAFQKAATFVELAKDVRSVDVVERNGKTCCRILFAGQADLNSKKEIYRFVYFARDLKFFPIAYENVTKDLKIISSYSVDEFGKASDPATGASILYPKVATATYYGLIQDLQDAPTAKYKYTITDLAINGTDDASFSFDPTMADVIYDEDKDIGITVPR